MTSMDALSNSDSNRKALDRIAHLVDVLCNPDRKVADSGHHAPAGFFLDDLIVTETEEATPADPLSENESGQRGWSNEGCSRKKRFWLISARRWKNKGCVRWRPGRCGEG